MINKYAQKQIDRIAKECKDRGIKIAIECTTYNHGSYLADTLEGFVNQQTNFPFVAIVHDDASTDNTADVLREYAAKYPDIIKPIYEKENQYSKRDGSLGRIMRKTIVEIGAPYIAFCEGDDYWTDPQKLQKQIDFLEANPDYTMVFTNAVIHYQDGRKEDVVMNNIPVSTVDPYRLYTEWWAIPTASFCIRKELYEFPKYKQCLSLKNVPFGDLQVAICAGLMGKIHYIDECMTVYRILNSGAANYLFTHQADHLYARIRVAKVFGKKYYKCEQHKLVSYLAEFLKRNNYRYLKICIEYAPVLTVKHLLERCKNILRKKVKRLF